ncbi:uncharacterized protein LOC106472941 [Limulus polyphemus]|uniref:Uncharacterized protein LOC106472941 n=1 Tax=Limulus polyphemus TaxID=6850 RepID=A0ABM1BUR6_LIMPO|nr:uncharacterized protein LOC106472941 [Limulus polyphemus]
MAEELNAQSQTQQKESRDNIHSVTATGKSESTTVGLGDGIKLNPWYFKSVPGIMKLVQVLIAIICFGCGSPAITSYSRFFLFVISICFIFTIFLVFIYLMGLQALLPNFPWLFAELIYTAIATALYIIAAIVELVMTSDPKFEFLRFIGYYRPYIAAGVFGLFNVLAYGGGLFFLLKEWRELRQTP